MAIGHLIPAALKALREHGHPDFWEIATYGGYEEPDSVTVECTQCGEVLVELINPNQEEEPDDKKAEDTTKRDKLYERVVKRFSSEDLDTEVHELKSVEAAEINNAGVEAQFDYIYETCGADWLEELLAEDDGGQ